MHRSLRSKRSWSAVALASVVTACSAEDPASSGCRDSARCAAPVTAGTGGAGGTIGGAGGAGGASGSGGFGNSSSPPITMPPSIEADAGLDAGPGEMRRDDCGQLTMIVRDFQAAHPDFERDPPFNFNDLFNLGQGEKNLVRPQLEQGFPAYAHPGVSPSGHVESPASYYQWYVDDPSANMRFEITLPFTEVSPGRFVYDNAAFFPIDGMGFGNEGNPHNFHFTTEVRTELTYMGGEVFTFRGDDDLWMFVNGQLVIDLGGMHAALEATVNFDAEAARLGLVLGETYPMEIFHAERHTTASNYRIETNIACFVPVEPPPPPPPPVVD